jgi:hypothetical protein
MPAFANNYEFAPIDLDGDGFLDLVTINDGSDSGVGLREHVFRNDGSGSFEDMTGEWWPDESNVGYDDNVVVAVDVESDGDADFFVASLDGPDRLLLNDGSGRLSLVSPIMRRPFSGGTLGWGVADLNGDRRPDLVESQGEVPGHEAEQVYLATDAIPPDSAPPIVAWGYTSDDGDQAVVHARIHDNRTPNMPHDWTLVEARWDGGGPLPLTWYGENLFRAQLDMPAGATGIRVCAVDAAGNEGCS